MSSTKTIYIVTSGEYSDYGIDRVFSTRQMAEEWCGDHLSGPSAPSKEYTIEEYKIDEPFDPKENIDQYSVVCLNTKTNHSYGSKPQSFEKVRTKYFQGERVIVFNNGEYMEVWSVCQDEDAAIKTAQEIKARLIALGRLKNGIYNYKTLEPIQ